MYASLMAGKGNPKTGGRKPGSMNLRGGVNKRRLRIRRDATAAIIEAMPRLRGWLASDAAWSAENAPASAKQLDALCKWVLPHFGAINPNLEAAPESLSATDIATAAAAQPIVDEREATQTYRMLISAPIGSPEALIGAERMRKMVIPQPLPAAVPEQAPALQPLEAPAGPHVSVIPPREAEAIRHAGIPLEDGARLIPKSAPVPSKREPGALPELPPVPVDVRPEQPEPRRSRADEFNGNGCIQRAPPDDPASRPASAGALGLPHWVR